MLASDSALYIMKTRTKNIDCPFIHDAVEYQKVHSQQPKSAYSDLIFRLSIEQLS